jgi:hypothetical protein
MRLVAILLVIVLLISIAACGKTPETIGADPTDEQTRVITPDIYVTVVEPTDDHEPEPYIPSDEVNDLAGMVYGSVTYSLECAGFTCGFGLAESLDTSEYSAFGLYYSNDGLELFREGIKSVGFVEISEESEPFFDPAAIEDAIMVTPVEEEPNLDLVCVYQYDNIAPSHFVYENKYVQYYQQTPMRIVYSVQDNLVENYDLSFGSLYDYDHREFIYDETIWGEYSTHSAENLFSDEDYEALESSLREISERQAKAGYSVDEYKIVYISPEAVQAYIDSTEEATFFGFSVSELIIEFGLGTALEYSQGGFQEADYLQYEREHDISNYNWKSFLTKVGVGCGIILVGTVLTPITGGVSFTCALVTIVEGTLFSSISGALVSLVIETTKGLVQGYSLKDALLNARVAGLNSFANGFVIGAAISSIGVASGLIQPTACFTGETKVSVMNPDGIIVLLPISSISIGDHVLCYDELTGENHVQRVSAVTYNYSYELVDLVINGELVRATPSHPFYVLGRGWIRAQNLKSGSILLSADGSQKTVETIALSNSEVPQIVYNLTVENDHTYYVGSNIILVHNACQSINSMRNQARDGAWKNEVEACLKNSSNYKWTDKQVAELLKNGKIAGYEAHHIYSVKELKETANQFLIKDPKDIVFLSSDMHTYIHSMGDTFGEYGEALVKLHPWVKRVASTLIPAA